MEAIIEKIYRKDREPEKENHTVKTVQAAVDIARELIQVDSSIKEAVVFTTNNVVYISDARDYRREEADLRMI